MEPGVLGGIEKNIKEERQGGEKEME
jgi:hypothetical protein